MMENKLLKQLRADTDLLHKQVEQLPGMSRLLSAEVTEQEYCLALHQLHRFMARVEPSLRQHFNSPDAVNYYYFPRLNTLESDLVHLCEPVPTPSKPALELDREQAVGAAYVVEGATMGGKVLAKRLSRTLNLSKNAGLKFFNFHRRGTHSLFVNWLHQLELSDDQTSRVSQGAVKSFQLLLDNQTT